MVAMGPAFFCCFRQVVALYRSFCPRLVQLGPGVVAIKKERWLPLTTINKFHSSDNTLSENAAYQLISGIGSQWRRYTSTKSLSAAQSACTSEMIHHHGASLSKQQTADLLLCHGTQQDLSLSTV